jgi:hypothetical protein
MKKCVLVVSILFLLLSSCEKEDIIIEPKTKTLLNKIDSFSNKSANVDKSTKRKRKKKKKKKRFFFTHKTKK